MSSIDVADLRLAYGATTVLDGLDLHVPSGGVSAVLGESGCGKTTLLRAIAGLVRPAAGEIRLGDDLVFGHGRWVRPERRNVGVVPQEGALFPHLDVGANVAFGLSGPAKERRVRVAQLLELVGMSGTESMRPHELSGGMQQRVAVARALSRNPRVILLDEPFSALDAGLRDDVRSEVFAAIRAGGATAVLVTHDQDEALSVADRVAVMRDGRIVQEGSPREVYGSPVDLGVARFVGEALELPAELVDAGAMLVASPLGDLVVQPEAGPVTEGPGTLLVRLEELDIEREDPGGGACPATVSDIRYYGHDCLISARMDQGPEVRIRALGVQELRPGDRGWVRVTTPPRFFPA